MKVIGQCSIQDSLQCKKQMNTKHTANFKYKVLIFTHKYPKSGLEKCRAKKIILGYSCDNKDT